MVQHQPGNHRPTNIIAAHSLSFPGDYLDISQICKGFSYFLWLRCVWFSDGTASQHPQALACRSVVQQACIGTPNTMLACTPHKMAGHTRITILKLIAGCPLTHSLTIFVIGSLTIPDRHLNKSPSFYFSLIPWWWPWNQACEEKSVPFAWYWCYW
jgi:hypothetical protein